MKKITDLPAAAVLTGPSPIETVQGGVSVQTTANAIVDLSLVNPVPSQVFLAPALPFNFTPTVNSTCEVNYVLDGAVASVSSMTVARTGLPTDTISSAAPSADPAAHSVWHIPLGVSITIADVSTGTAIVTINHIIIFEGF